MTQTADVVKKLNIFDLEERIPFGKHRGMSLSELAEAVPDYLQWLLKVARSREFAHWWVLENEDAIEAALRQSLVNLIESAPELNLTDHQQEIVDELVAAIDDGLRIVRLEGGAGYGKSYVTGQLAKTLSLRGYTVRATAVSYVATQVLATQLRPYGVQTATLARTLKFDKTFNNDTGAEEYVFSAETHLAASEALADQQALIVDECSMINDEVANLLFEVTSACGGLLILVGDSKQLPPVNQEHVSKCCEPWSKGVATLTKPMRYSKDSDLYQVEQIARHNPAEIFNIGQRLFKSPSVSIVRDGNALLQSYLENYHADSTALHRMFMFRRRDVVAMNNRIRNYLFSANAPLIVEDERLMVMATADVPYDPAGTDSIRYYSGQNFCVEHVEQDIYEIDIAGTKVDIPCYYITFDGRPRAVRVVFAVTEYEMDSSKVGGAEYKAALQLARQYALEQKELNATRPPHERVEEPWRYFKQLSSDFLRVAYMYASSVHRAQGQTCDYAYCAPGSLLQVQGIMGDALAYVALTRARKHLTIQV